MNKPEDHRQLAQKKLLATTKVCNITFEYKYEMRYMQSLCTRCTRSVNAAIGADSAVNTCNYPATQCIDAVIFRASHLVGEVEQSLWARRDAAYGMVFGIRKCSANCRTSIRISSLCPVLLALRWLRTAHSARSETISICNFQFVQINWPNRRIRLWAAILQSSVHKQIRIASRGATQSCTRRDGRCQ